MRFGRPFAQHQVGGNFPIAPPLCNKCGYFAFASGESLICSPGCIVRRERFYRWERCQGCMQEMLAQSRLIDGRGKCFDDLPRCAIFTLGLLLAFQSVIQLPEQTMDTPEDGLIVTRFRPTFRLLEGLHCLLEARERHERLSLQFQQVRNELCPLLARSRGEQVFCPLERTARLAFCEGKLSPDPGDLPLFQGVRKLLTWHDGGECCCSLRQIVFQHV